MVFRAIFPDAPEADKKSQFAFFAVFTYFPPPGMTIQDISKQRRFIKPTLKNSIKF
jgi:hypothetical protein